MLGRKEASSVVAKGAKRIWWNSIFAVTVARRLDGEDVSTRSEVTVVDGGRCAMNNG